MGEILKDGPWAGFEVIHTYTRQQAIEAGLICSKFDCLIYQCLTGFNLSWAAA
jgi:hypothetical protein